MEKRKRRISGPGAGDFLAAPGGEDIPGFSPSKGDRDLGLDAPLTDAANLEPDLADSDSTDATPRHRERGVPRGRDEG